MTVGRAPGLAPGHSICLPVRTCSCVCVKVRVCAYMSPQPDWILLHAGTPGQSPMAPAGMPPTHTHQCYTSNESLARIEVSN